MLSAGSTKRRSTLMLLNNGRRTPSVTDDSRAIMGFIAACMLTKV